MFKPLFSIIVTTHKRPNLLVRALSSITVQTLQDFEIILISDVYDLLTIEVAKNNLREKDTFIMSPHLIGPAESRNMGIKIAKGKWIVFLDDDDAYTDDLLLNLKEGLDNNTSDVYYTNYIKAKEDRSNLTVIEANKYDISNVDLKLLEISNFIPNCCVIVNSNLAKHVDFDSKLQSHEDWDWLINLSQFAVFKHIKSIGPIIYESNAGSRNLNAHYTNNLQMDYLSIYRKWKGKTEQIRLSRKNFLAEMGYSIDSSFL